MTSAERLVKAKQALRVDGNDNDEIIQALADAIPAYIETVTGMSETAQETEPLCCTVFQFIIRLWYYADHADDVKLSRTIENLLKCITLKANSAAREAQQQGTGE